MKYCELNFEDLKKLDAKKIYILIPVGCIEVHGPNLPLGSDTFLAEAFADLIGKKIESIIMPTISYGYSAITKEIHGTISVDIEIVANYITRIIYNLIELRFEKFVIINIHKDNDLAIKLVLDKIFEEYNIPILYINPFLDYKDIDKKVFSNDRNSYKETSLIWASQKILGGEWSYGNVDLKGPRYKKPIFLKKLLDTGYIKYKYINEMQHISPERYYSLEEGTKYMELVVSKVIKNISFLDKYIKFLKKTNGQKSNS